MAPAGGDKTCQNPPKIAKTLIEYRMQSGAITPQSAAKAYAVRDCCFLLHVETL